MADFHATQGPDGANISPASHGDNPCLIGMRFYKYQPEKPVNRSHANQSFRIGQDVSGGIKKWRIPEIAGVICSGDACPGVFEYVMIE